MSGTELTYLVAADVVEERKRQEVKWGEQNHGRPRYFAILGEEFGEVARAVTELAHYEDRLAAGDTTGKDPDGVVRDIREVISLWEKNYLKELTQTAAVAQAMIECVLRNKARQQTNRDMSQVGNWTVIQHPAGWDGNGHPATVGIKGLFDGVWYGVYTSVTQLMEMEYNPKSIISALVLFAKDNKERCRIVEGVTPLHIALGDLMAEDPLAHTKA